MVRQLNPFIPQGRAGCTPFLSGDSGSDQPTAGQGRGRENLLLAGTSRLGKAAEQRRGTRKLTHEFCWRPEEKDQGSGCHHWAAGAVGRSERVRQYRADGMTDHTIPPADVRERGWAKDDDARALETAAQADLLRYIIGPACFRPASIAHSVLAWNQRLVVRLAQSIYDERRFCDLPLLGDALLDAGCEDEALLAYCRAGGEHARGCLCSMPFSARGKRRGRRGREQGRYGVAGSSR